MKVSQISVCNSLNKRPNIKHQTPKCVPTKHISPSFNGDRGAVIGILGGFLAGAGITALTIATGGLAGIVAAVGSASATTIAGGAACTHLGGIAGALIEDHLDKKSDDKKN